MENTPWKVNLTFAFPICHGLGLVKLPGNGKCCSMSIWTDRFYYIQTKNMMADGLEAQSTESKEAWRLPTLGRANLLSGPNQAVTYIHAE